jgi:hypothetical protein
LEEVGRLDEQVEFGMFEYDYTRRVRDAGYRAVRVNELFVHSFRDAAPSGRDGDREGAIVYEFARPTDAAAGKGTA